MKVLFILALGAGIGYAYGYRDASHHEKNVVERLVERVEGIARAGLNADLDAQMRDVGK
jgi:hypothetical protein